MDRNSIVGIILIAVILIGYSIITKPQREEMAEQRRVADSIRIAEQAAAAEALPEKTPDTNRVETPVAPPVDTGSYGTSSEQLQGEEEYFTLENDKLIITVTNHGGKPYSVELKDYQTYDSLPLYLFEGPENLFGLEFFSDGRTIRTNDLFFDVSEGSKKMNASSSPQTLAMKLPVDSLGAYIEYRYTLNPESYLIDFDIRMKNMDNYRTDFVQLKWEVFSPQQERGRQNESQYTNLKYKYFEGDVEKFKTRSKKELQTVTENTKLEWIGYKQQFFSSVILADQLPFEGGDLTMEDTPETSKYIRHFRSELQIPYDRTSDFRMPMQIYYGPNHFQSLKKLGYGLENLVTVGGSIIRWINAFVIIPIFNWLDNFISNYGIIILVLTIIIKMALLPLTYRSYMSQAKMRALKPEIDEINKKIPKEKAMERQQAATALYRKVGANPMGGCLPILLQMPILYAMFRFFPASIELRQESFLWAKDLSTYDSVLNLPFTIPMYGDHVSLFTLLMTVSTIFSMKLNSNPTGADSQMPGMKGMMYIMPVMFMVILNNFSAGLTYYYFLANLITLGQNFLFKQFVDEEALRKKLHAKKAKPKKKSGFQKRLEEAAKQRGYNLPKK
ncbi:MAG: membrane protein insertase YidC [Bacteroidales bacterium]